MKKILRTFLWGAVIASSLVVAGCAKEYNDSELRNKISDLDSRVSALEEQVKKLNEVTIPGIQNIITALQEKLVVTKVQKNETDGSYTILFSDGSTVNISNGPKGETGPSPVMGVQLVDGVYCWTVNGQLIKDAENNPVPVHGADGATPTFRSTTDGLEYSIDGGKTWIPVPVAEGSVPPISFIETETSVIFKFADGTTFEVAKELDFSIVFTIPSNTSAMTGETIYIGYTLAGVAEDDVTEVGILTVTPGFEAVVEPYEGQNDAGIIAITNNDENANVVHKVYVFAANGKGKTDIKGLSFSSSTIKAVLSVATVPAAGGSDILLNVKANEDYTVSVSTDAASWITVADPTRALYEDKLAVTVAENTTNEYRSGTITLTSKTSGEVLQELDLLQGPVVTEATSLTSISVLPDNTKVTLYNVSTVAASDTQAIVTDGTTKMYVLAKGLYAPAVFDLTGVKNTDPNGLTYVDVTSLQMKMEAEPIVLDKYENYISYSFVPSGYGYSYFSVNGTLIQIDGTYCVSNYTEAYTIVLDGAPAELGLEPLLNKKVTLKGWAINGNALDSQNALINAIATEVTELTFAEQSSWSMSYTDGTATLTAGAEDTYTFFVMSEADVVAKYGSVEKLISEYSYEVIDDQQINIFFYKYYGYDYATAYSEIFYTGPAQGPLDIDYGKSYGIMLGVDPDATLNGKYAVAEFQKEDPRVKASYEDFLGDWTFTNSAGAQEVWTLTKKVDGQSYYISGINGMEAPLGGEPAEAVFADGVLTVSNQLTLGEPFTYQSYTLQDKFVAIFYSGTHLVSNENYMTENPLIFTVSLMSDGSAQLTYGKDDSGYELEGFAYLANVVDGNQVMSYNDGTRLAGAAIYKGQPVVPVVPELPTVFKDDFESAEATASWTLLDIDGDGYNWSHHINGNATNNLTAHSGSGVLTSSSYENSVGALKPNNWAITPEFTLTSNNYVSLWVIGQDKNYCDEKYGVYLLEGDATADNLANAVELTTGVATGGYTQVVCPIASSYNGKTVRLCVRHFDVTDMFMLNVDDVAVTEGDPTAVVPTSAPVKTAKSVSTKDSILKNAKPQAARSYDNAAFGKVKVGSYRR